MKTLTNRQKIEAGAGFALIALVIILGITGAFASTAVFVKCLIGLGFGYALTRGDYGFAGLSNRTWRVGSTKLIRALMLMFVVSAVIVGAFVASKGIFNATTNPDGINLWIRPISWGLLFGGILFGAGMAFSSCCATGVCQDIPIGFARAGITLIFFGVGVFLGFPLMSSGFAQNSLFTSASFNGVWFGDWFQWDGANGVIGGILITVLLAALVGAFAKWYQKKIAKNYPKVTVNEEEKEYTTWERFFVKKWSLTQTALVIAILFGMLYAVSSAGWGASTVYGNWFGTILAKLGVDVQALVNYTGKPASSFTTPLFASTHYMQNIGIIVGAFIGMLLSGNFTKTFVAGLKIKPLEIALFAMGGLFMGFGTRISLGCNVGALYTPIADFSLSGWFYFFALFAGGYLGNKIWKWFYHKVDPSKL